MEKYQQIVNNVIMCPAPQYPNRSIYVEKILGMGGQGGVFLAKFQNGDPSISTVAVKIQEGLGIQEQAFMANLIQYQNLYENPQSQYYYPSSIIRIYEMFSWQNKTTIIMEVGNGNLFEYLTGNRLSLQEKEKICKQVLKSIQMLHHFGYAHRDIKPENFLRVGDEWKLCDFGLTKSVKDSSLMTKHIGSANYMAPELLISNNQQYTEKVDTWSLGCVFYEILEGTELFKGSSKDQLVQSILESNKILKFQVNGQTIELTYIQKKINEMQISDFWKKLLSQMLQHRPEQRPSIEDVIEIIKQNEKSPNIEQNYILKDMPKSIKTVTIIYQTPQNIQQNNAQIVQDDKNLEKNDPSNNQSHNVYNQSPFYQQPIYIQPASFNQYPNLNQQSIMNQTPNQLNQNQHPIINLPQNANQPSQNQPPLVNLPQHAKPITNLPAVINQPQNTNQPTQNQTPIANQQQNTNQPIINQPQNANQPNQAHFVNQQQNTNQVQPNNLNQPQNANQLINQPPIVNQQITDQPQIINQPQNTNSQSQNQPLIVNQPQNQQIQMQHPIVNQPQNANQQIQNQPHIVNQPQNTNQIQQPIVNQSQNAHQPIQTNIVQPQNVNQPINQPLYVIQSQSTNQQILNLPHIVNQQQNYPIQNQSNQSHNTIQNIINSSQNANQPILNQPTNTNQPQNVNSPPQKILQDNIKEAQLYQGIQDNSKAVNKPNLVVKPEIQQEVIQPPFKQFPFQIQKGNPNHQQETKTASNDVNIQKFIPNQQNQQFQEKEAQAEQAPGLDVQQNQPDHQQILQYMINLDQKIERYFKEQNKRIENLENKKIQNMEQEEDFNKKADFVIELSQQLNSSLHQLLQGQSIEQLQPDKQKKIQLIFEQVKLNYSTLQAFCKEY